MEDYIMLIDENGQPYIAHGVLGNAASGIKRGARQTHKYIMKIGEGAKARYFYTQQEIDAYKKEMADKAKNAVDQVKSTSDRMKDEFRKKAEDKAGRATESVKNAVANVKNKLGVDEKQRLNQAIDYRDRTMNMLRKDNLITGNFSKDAKQQEDAQKMVDVSREEYHKTPIGKVSKAKDTIENKIDETKNKINEKSNKIKTSVKETIDKIERERDFDRAPKVFEKKIKEDAKNQGISIEEVKQNYIDWTQDYYTKGGDIERRDRYIDAINKAFQKAQQEYEYEKKRIARGGKNESLIQPWKKN